MGPDAPAERDLNGVLAWLLAGTRPGTCGATTVVALAGTAAVEEAFAVGVFCMAGSLRSTIIGETPVALVAAAWAGERCGIGRVAAGTDCALQVAPLSEHSLWNSARSEAEMLELSRAASNV